MPYVAVESRIVMNSFPHEMTAETPVASSEPKLVRPMVRYTVSP